MVCESVRLFALCDAMNWAQLPLAGGIYDQHPKLIDDFYYIFSERSKVHERELKETKRQANVKKPKF